MDEFTERLWLIAFASVEIDTNYLGEGWNVGVLEGKFGIPPKL